MKNSTFLLLFVFFLSCSQKAEVEEDVGSFALSVESLSFDCEGGMQKVGIETNISWDIVTSLPSWLSIEEQSNNHVLFSAVSNETEKCRTFQVLFSTEKGEFPLSIWQDVKGKLAFKDKTDITITSEKNSYLIEVLQNISYKVKCLDKENDWISFSSDNDNLFNDIGVADKDFTSSKFSLHVNENLSQEKRNAKIVIYNGTYHLSDTLCIIQNGSIRGKYTDGEYIQLQKASQGNVNLVIMGDGFTSKHLYFGGEYEQAMYKAVEYYFSIEPYRSYRNYFNIYMVVAESPSEGVGEKNSLGISTFNNKFDTAFGSGTEIVCNDDLIFEYSRKVKELPENTPLTVIVVLNSTKYAGTAYLYSDGNSIALCPMSAEQSPNDFEGIIHHEAGGHGFGFLCDEYVYWQKNIPASRKQNIKEWQKLGFQMNLDFTNDPSSILWKDFIGLDKYKQVGAYEGGYEYQYGVWRSEENSCMNNNVPYFNVQSRWSIVKRIMQLSEKEFTIRDFIENDNVVPNIVTRNIVDKSFKPLGDPIWIR